MDSVFEFLGNNGNMVYGIVILLGGKWGLRYFDLFRSKALNFLLFATLFGMLFVLIEMGTGAFMKEHAIKYLLTYTVVTSCYETILKHLPFLKDKDR